MIACGSCSSLVDLEFYKKERLDESFLRMFGGAIKMLLQHIFEDASAPIEVRGTKSEIKAFADVLGKEKRYMQAYSDLGLNNPATYKSKYLLDEWDDIHLSMIMLIY